MILLGLSQRELNKLFDLLVTHHRIAVNVQLLTLEHKYVGDITKRLLGGQVTIDADASEASRSCSLELLDPHHQLSLDADAPEDGSLYATRMVKVIYSVISVDRKDRFDIPIFCGPLSKVNRNGPILQVEAQGKEVLSMSSVWKSRDFKKGMKKTEVIQVLMEELGGEKKMDFAKSNARIPRRMGISRDKTSWDLAQSIARSMNMHLFYDGRGVCRLRPMPTKPIYTFSRRGALLSPPQAGYDMMEAVNAVQVIGGKPKGSKKKITYRMVAPKSHALSPWKLGRWGTPRYLPEVIEDSSIRSKTEARKIAISTLRARLVQSVEVTFDSLPIPLIEEMDICRVTADDFSGTFRMSKMTIPLTANGTSSIGYLRKTAPGRVTTKKKRRPKKRNKGKGKGGK